MTSRLCFECGRPAEHDRYVVPRSAGGTKTVPLCAQCHDKAKTDNERLEEMLAESKPQMDALLAQLERDRPELDALLAESGARTDALLAELRKGPPPLKLEAIWSCPACGQQRDERT